MKTGTKKAFAASGLLSLAAAMVSSVALAQDVPRTPSGKPDFSGIWQAMTTAHFNVEPHAAMEGPHSDVMGALSAIPGSLGVIEEGKIPYTEQALRTRDANRIDAIDKDPLTKCYMPGVPRLIAYEFAEANRILYVDQPEIESQVDAWMGHSNAHWEGDTLVVRVSGQMPDTWFDRAGNHHSWEMVVEERYTPMGANHIDYSATITDPNTFTAPWAISFPLYRHVDENMQLLEFKCAEFSEEYLYGQYRKPGTPKGNPQD